MQHRIARAVARSLIYEYFSVGFLYPKPETFGYLTDRHPAVRSSLRFIKATETGTGLDAFWSLLSQRTASALEVEYCGLFTHTISDQCPPYEGEYDTSDIFQKSQAMADIAGFYWAFGLELSPSFQERPDHISAELEFLHYLTRKEALALQLGHGRDKADLCLDAQKRFLESHCGRWVPLFERRLQGMAGAGLYGVLGRMVGAFVRRETRTLGLAPAPLGDVDMARKPGMGEGCPGCSPGNQQEVEPCL